ncbi:Uncharacterised protein [Streptococcus pneumoniae]|nr:Uncharacterised protein [Streptococcus pneumoniae]VQA97045.1 Uncharacterised protein [Streptococcus pneumoniae]VSB89429.1 Uncharacterised protein [Streptococcus pneumoniae]VSC26326.1 Uncharacterised protein [Streptococcus pneumoniae]VSC70388.1 Uncharacterised protein [Streptococcus pneumoniae]
MSVNKNNLSDIADYHEKIKFFEELFNLDYNPTEMLVTVERNGNVIYKEFTEVAVGKSKYDYTSVFKDVMIYFSDIYVRSYTYIKHKTHTIINLSLI